MKRLNRLIRMLGIVVLGIALYQELQKAPEERTWHGKVADIFPYEFRLPTMERIQSRIWNASDPHVFMPTLFGVGWTVNLGRVYYLLTSQIGDHEATRQAE